jgi:hypothetical protein
MIKRIIASGAAIPLAIAVAGSAVILLVTLLLPLGFDNDVYESMAWTLYAYHGLPYIASWDMNFPGIVFIHWLSIVLFGASDFGFRMFDYLIHVAMSGAFYLLLRRWLSTRESVLAVLIYALYYASGGWGLAGQRDTYASFLLICSVILLCSLYRRSRWGSALALGVLAGCAALVRPTYFLFALAFILLIWELPNNIRLIGYFLLGYLLPFVVWLLPYMPHHGGLEQIYYSIIRFNLDLYSSVHVPFDLLTRGRAPIYLLAVTGLFFALYLSRKQKIIPLSGKSGEKSDLMMILLFTGCALLSPLIMRKFFTYHFEPFMLIVIAFAAIGLDRITGLFRVPALKYGAIVIALGLFIYSYYPRHLLRYYFEDRKNERPLQATYDRVLSDTLFGLSAQREVINYLDRSVRQNDPVEYVSLFPSLRWRMARPEATGFTTIVPICAADGAKSLPNYVNTWRRGFIDSLASVRPRYIITSRSQEWWPFVGMNADAALHSIPGFDSLLSARYVPDTVIKGFNLYRIRI